MRVLFELSKEYATLPSSEILACLEAQQIPYTLVEKNENVLIIETLPHIDMIISLASRLSLLYHIDQLLFSASHLKGDIKNKAMKHEINTTGTVGVKYRNRSRTIDSRPIVKILSEIYTSNKTVDLDNPDIEIRTLLTDSQVYVGTKIAEIDRNQFERRKVHYRPFFSPISLHPKLARALVNLSRVRMRETLLDPFCGTGGILIEAGLMGIKVIGNDVTSKIAEGCKKNLDFYNIKNYQIFCGDVGDIKNHVDQVDGVVTDFPYGRSTTTRKESPEKLYERGFQSISNVLKHGKRAVIGTPQEDLLDIGKQYFWLEEKHTVRVHRSLTRNFGVFQK